VFSSPLQGKINPNVSLEWQTKEHADDYMRFPVYAGKVALVQKVRKVTVCIWWLALFFLKN
jgi:hypothetical protein